MEKENPTGVTEKSATIDAVKDDSAVDVQISVSADLSKEEDVPADVEISGTLAEVENKVPTATDVENIASSSGPKSLSTADAPATKKGTVDYKKLARIRKANNNAEAEQKDFLCIVAVLSDQGTLEAHKVDMSVERLSVAQVYSNASSFKQLKRNAKKHDDLASKVEKANLKELMELLSFLKDVPSSLNGGTFTNYVFNVETLAQAKAAVQLRNLNEWSAGKVMIGNVEDAVRREIVAFCKKNDIKVV